MSYIHGEGEFGVAVDEEIVQEPMFGRFQYFTKALAEEI